MGRTAQRQSPFYREICDILPRVRKPTRYAGGEFNEVVKDPKGKMRVGMAFPDAYEVGMSHLGSHILYREFNSRSDVWAERFYAPRLDMEEHMRERGVPLFSLESWTPARRFDIMGFTLQYEMTYTNILNMLDLGNIPVYAQDRSAEDPLVLGGGPCAFNPEPVAEFFDALVLGDGEEVIHEIVDLLRSSSHWSAKTLDREKVLKQLSGVKGVYVPALYRVKYDSSGRIEQVENMPPAPERVQRRIVADLEEVCAPTEPVVPFGEVVHDRMMIEVFRGCTRGCRFCQAGTIYRPVRERPKAQIVNLAEQLVEGVGSEELALLSLSTSDHSQIESLLEELLEVCSPYKIDISLPSLRADEFSVNLADKASEVRRSGLTLAPEAGTQRLRDVINKGISEGEYRRALRRAFQAGWDRVKLYFMLGLPTETDADIAGIARLVEDAFDLYGEHRNSSRPLEISLSVSSFIPKPHTPFQWEKQLHPRELRRRQRYLSDLLPHGHVDLAWDDVNLSLLEAVFARGDRRLAPVLVSAWREGCRFDGWGEHFDFSRWKEAFEEHDVSWEEYANRVREPDEMLPWDHLQSGVKREFLLRERRRSFREEPTGDCRWESCSDCGICTETRSGLVIKGRGDEARGFSGEGL